MNPFTLKISGSTVLGVVAIACLVILFRGGGSIFGAPLESAQAWLLASTVLAGFCGAAVTLRGGVLSGFLAAMLFAGGTAQLWLTEPDWFASLRIRPQGALHLLMLLTVVAQGAISALAVAFFCRCPRAPRVTLRSAAAVALVIAIASAFCISIVEYARTRDWTGLVAHLVPGAYAVGAFLLNAVALALAPDLPIAKRDHFRTSKTAVVICALFAFGASMLLAVTAFGGVALVQDETVYLFQAETFAQGALFAPPAPPGTAPSFVHYLIDEDERGRFAVVAPGFAAALAPFAAANLHWLLNPILGGLSVLLIHAIVRRIWDIRRANLAAVLSATSPWLLFSSAALMTHALSLTLTLGAALLALSAKIHLDERRPRVRIAAMCFCAGLLMGWLFLTRALEGVLLGGALGVWTVFAFGRAAPHSIAAYGAGCLVTGSLLFAFNAAYSGEILVSPLSLYIGELWGPTANAIGFGADRGPPEGWGALDLAQGHSALEGVLNIQNGLSSMSYDLFGWTAGSLALLAAWLVFGERSSINVVMAGILALIVGVHFFYWFNAAFYIGPRYWYGAFAPIILLSIAGFDALVERLGTQATARATVVLLMLCVFGATTFTGWRAIEKYAKRSEDGRQLLELTRDASYDDALFLVADKRLAEDAMILNHPFFEAGKPIFAYAPTPEQEARLRAAYPDRRPVNITRSGD